MKWLKTGWRFLAIILMLACFALAWLSNINHYFVWKEQQYTLIAKSFLAGKTYFLESPDNWVDTTIANGLHYWPLGPLPSVLMMLPVLIFDHLGAVFLQGYVTLAMLTGVFFLSFYIARKFNYANLDAGMLAFAMCFASVYQIAAFIPFSWYVVQAVAMFITLASLGEYLSLKRYWVIGILMGSVFAARYTAGLGIIFFLLEAIWEKGSLKQKTSRVVQLVIPSIIIGILLLVYNQVRFGNMWNNGYMDVNKGILTDDQRYETVNYGLFKLENIPSNIYYYFIKSPEPVTIQKQTMWGNTYVLTWPFIKSTYPGISFWVTAPIFLFIFRASFKERRIKSAGITALIILGLLMAYYWPGWRQTGPRYLMDLLPFIYLILLTSFPNRKLSFGVQLLILGSAALDLLFLVQTIWT
jgi:hypothetical protein